jgi:hypothetical protein
MDKPYAYLQGYEVCHSPFCSSWLNIFLRSHVLLNTEYIYWIKLY